MAYLQDEKGQPKKDSKEDVEMKVDEPAAASTSGGGDISPIAEAGAGLSEDISKSEEQGKEKSSENKRSRKEPSFEKLSNFSRVMPAQLAHISFPAEGRYQPVRPVATRSAQKTSKGKAVASATSKPTSTAAALGTAAERYAGGGGILILIDQTPSEPAEFIETELPRPAAPTVPTAAEPSTTAITPAPNAAVHIALDENEPEAQPPESFEVSSCLDCTSVRQY
jgi:26S proteasome regulatory subunit N2